MTRLLPKFMGWKEETPSGTINGSNVTFTLSSVPYDVATLDLTLDGMAQVNGIHFTIAGLTITFATAPASSQDLFARFRKV